MKKALLAICAFVIPANACSSDYVAECKEVYTQINQLPCINVTNKFDLDLYCPEEYNENGKNYNDFFDCIKKNITCSDDKTLDNKVANCLNL